MILYEPNILSESDLIEINYLINNFKEEYIPVIGEARNDYFKQRIFLSDSLIQKIRNIIKNHTNKEVVIKGEWLNKIDSNSNNDDDFHRDDTDLSFVIYPNKTFEGGELEYLINNKSTTIDIIENSALMLLHKVEHRVKPVISGIRWSIAIFCIYDIKSKSIV